MKTNTYIIFLVGISTMTCATRAAQNYPLRPVRTLVPLAAGGGMDTVTRSLSIKLGEAFAQSFVVDNRPGAGSQIALDILSTAAPDGHTLMMLSATTVVHPLLYKSRYDITRDFTPITQVTAQGYVLVVHPAVPAKSALEFAQYLKANPDKVNYSSSGIDSLIHMSGELFKSATANYFVDCLHQRRASACAGGHAGQARTGVASSADLRRGWRQRRGGGELVWPDCAAKNPRGHR